MEELFEEDEDLFTDEISDDILFTKYSKWEEIPVSTLKFETPTKQICYISLPKEDAVNAIKLQAIQKEIIAYEYIDEVPIKQNEVKLAITIDTENMLDLTHKSEYIKYLKSTLNKSDDSYKNNPLIRKVITSNNTGLLYQKIVYSIKDNSVVKHIDKIEESNKTQVKPKEASNSNGQ